MGFTYNAKTPGDRDKLRLLIADTQDVDANGNPVHIFEDEELDTILSLVGGSGNAKLFRAAAQCFRVIAGDRAKLVARFQIGEKLDVDYRRAVDKALRMAEAYESKADEAALKGFGTSIFGAEVWQERVDEYGRDRTLYADDDDTDTPQDYDWDVLQWDALD